MFFNWLRNDIMFFYWLRTMKQTRVKARINCGVNRAPLIHTRAIVCEIQTALTVGTAEVEGAAAKIKLLGYCL